MTYPNYHKNPEERTMKKLLALLMALCLLVVLGGCQKLQQAADAVNAKEFSLGTVNGNSYENDFVGIRCDLPQAWTIYDEAQLAKMIGLISDTFTEGDFEDLVEETGSSIIFYAENTSTLSSINITVADTESYDLAMSDHKKLVDAMVEQMPEMMEQTYSTNITDINVEADTFSFCGEDTYGTYITASVYGAPIFQRQVIAVEGTYNITLTVCSYYEDSTMELLELFTAYEG